MDVRNTDAGLAFSLVPFFLQFLYLPSIINLGTDNMFCLMDHKGMCIPSQVYSLYFCTITNCHVV